MVKSLHDIFNLEQFDHLEWVSHQVVEGFITGLHRSPYHGFSVEFAEHRLYNQGESTKYIDWKLYARTEKLFVKKFEEETNLRCMIMLDTSSSMLFPFTETRAVNKLNFSIYSAAALIHLLRKQRDAAGITLFSNEIEFISGVKLSETHGKMLYSQLGKTLHRDKQHFNKTTNADEAIHKVADMLHPRSLVILFTDMFTHDITRLFAAIEHLKYNKHEVILFHVTDKELEANLQYANRPAKFIDMETGTEIKLNPNYIRTDYQTAYQSFLNQLRLKCGQYRIDLIEADINKGFAEVLIPFLVKRKTMY